jgi:hypothetical protein
MPEIVSINPIYYRPSGRLSAQGAVLAWLVMIPAAMLMGVAEVYALLFMHNIILSIFADVASAFALGWLLASLIRYGRIRNEGFATVLSLVSGSLMVYAAWACWVMLYHGQHLDALSSDNFTYAFDPNVLLFNLQHPLITWRGILDTEAHISYDILYNTTNISGPIVYVFWALEWPMVCFLLWVLPSTQAVKVYCEASNEWAQEYKLPALEYISDPQQMREALERRDYTVLDRLELSSHAEMHGDTAGGELYYSPHRYEFYLSLTNTRVNEQSAAARHLGGGVVAAAGKYSFDHIVDRITISAAAGEKLLSRFQMGGGV